MKENISVTRNSMIPKVGLLTYHHTTNFGSLLQTYSLYLAVKKLGYNCEIIDYRNETVEKREFLKHIYQCHSIREIKDHIKYSRFKKNKAQEFTKFCVEKLSVSNKRYNHSDINKVNGIYYCYLVGSDLVWDFSINAHDTAYMLDFANDKTKKVAFASSVGKIWEENDRIKVKRLLERFDSIGVREHAIQSELKQMLNKHVDFVCDPTMLLTTDEWHEMSSGRIISEDYILCYMANPGQSMYKDAIDYGIRHNLPVYLISYGWVPEGMNPIRPNRVDEFLSLILYAHTVFTASYHGMLFSLYFNKTFYYYNRGWKERMRSIAEVLNVTKREEWKRERNTEDIDYCEVNQKIDDFRKKSMGCLKSYLSED